MAKEKSHSIIQGKESSTQPWHFVTQRIVMYGRVYSYNEILSAYHKLLDQTTDVDKIQNHTIYIIFNLLQQERINRAILNSGLNHAKMIWKDIDYDKLSQEEAWDYFVKAFKMGVFPKDNDDIVETDSEFSNKYETIGELINDHKWKSFPDLTKVEEIFEYFKINIQNTQDNVEAIQRDPNIFEYENKESPNWLTEFYNRPGEERFSATIEIWDAIPKSVWAKKEKKSSDGKPIKRIFKHRDTEYTVTIIPAWIEENKNGKEEFVSYFPGEREDLVETVLRKLAMEGRGRLLDSNIGVMFSVNEIQVELKKKGHSANYNDIKKSLQILRGTSIILPMQEGQFEESYILSLGLSGKGRKQNAYIRFNSLTTKSIERGSYRLFNYDKLMEYKNVMSRLLHKRLAHVYKQASYDNFYQVYLSRLYQDFGFSWVIPVVNNVIKFENALDEMKQKEVIRDFEKKAVFEGKKTVDYHYTIKPHRKFCGEVMAANTRQKEIAGKSGN